MTLFNFFFSFNFILKIFYIFLKNNAVVLKQTKKKKIEEAFISNKSHNYFDPKRIALWEDAGVSSTASGTFFFFYGRFASIDNIDPEVKVENCKCQFHRLRCRLYKYCKVDFVA